MQINEYHFTSNTGVCEIYGNKYIPDGDIKGVLVLHHGMAEHQDRYADFISCLTEQGIAVYMHDMANHGKSNQDKALTGYFGKKDGYKAIVADFKHTFEMAKSENPNSKIIVMGHSMGSFVVRCFTAWYNSAGFDGAIYMGTGGANPVAAMGDKISSLVAKMTGYTKKVKLLDKMAFGEYNKKFEGRTEYDWLTRDTDVVDRYIADEYCGFLFSAQGMNDLIKLNISANTDEWYSNVPMELPILVISGADDPVGEYSKGINEIGERLKASGHTSVDVKLYADCRHEILNELNKDDVYKYISDFINSII